MPAAAPRIQPRIGAMLRYSLRLQLGSARTVVLGLLHLVPLLLAALWWLSRRFELLEVFSDGRELFGILVMTLYRPTLLLLATVFYGCAVVREEVENKTLTYLLVRPIPKWAIYLGRTLAALVVVLLLLSLSLTLCYAVCALASASGTFQRNLGLLARDLGALSLGALAYTAVFALLSAAFKHPMLIGLALAFGWENLVGHLPWLIGKLTLSHHLRALLSHPEAGGSGLQALLARLLGTPTPPAQAAAVLASVALAALALGAWLFQHREYPIEQ
ncbi:MAG TPA: ABC transporter permease [Acidobacteriota bacterium]